MAVAKNKFVKSLELSHKEIKGKRAKMFAVDAEEDSAEFIREINKRKRETERTLLNLEDFHADSTTTLKVTKDGFNSAAWVAQINEAKLELTLIEQELKIAEDIHKEYFA